MSQKINKKIVSELSTPRLSPKIALMVGTGMMLSGYASAQTNPEVSDRLLQKIEEQDRKIAERDKVIEDLMRRMQQLEKREAAMAQAGPAATGPIATAQAKPAVTAPISTQQPVQQGVATPTSTTIAAATTPKPQQAKSDAGSFLVDEDAAQRALERTLVQTGALLLPYGQAEIQPFVTYARREIKSLVNIYTSGNNNDPLLLGAVNASDRRNEFDMGANFLVGLPFESQVELRIPYRIVNETRLIGEGVNSTYQNNTGNSIGDISVGLAKTLMHESGWMPDLIGRFTWDSASQSLSNNEVILGGGYDDFITSLTALKRQDPLAFTARIAYQTSLERNGIDPGDQASVSIGATLAASPQTSFSIGLQQTYAQETKLNNVRIPGSDMVSSAFTMGASSTVGRNFFVSMTGGIGLTEESPAYFFNFTIPFRFDVPYHKLSGNKS